MQSVTPKVVTFGEIMGRFAAPGFQRFRQCLPGSIDVTFAGAEANVAASVSMMGVATQFVTALPENDLAEACVGSLRNVGVGTDHIIRSPGRLGLYFLETGANQRPSRVIYDREGSAISRTRGDAYDWSAVFRDASWFHFSGITPALSEIAFAATLDALRVAREQGVTVSCDLNFRKKLWRWEAGAEPRALAEKTMRQLLPFVDMVIANEEDCHDVLGIAAADTDVHKGELEIDRYPDVAQQVASQFPNVKTVAITLRESRSASHNNWGAMLYDAVKSQETFAPLDEKGGYQPYEIRNMVDRVGGGDAFAAGLIFASLTEGLSDSGMAIRFAVAASCLAQSIKGDFNFSTREEVETLMCGSGSGRVVR